MATYLSRVAFYNLRKKAYTVWMCDRETKQRLFGFRVAAYRLGSIAQVMAPADEREVRVDGRKFLWRVGNKWYAPGMKNFVIQAETREMPEQ